MNISKIVKTLFLKLYNIIQHVVRFCKDIRQRRHPALGPIPAPPRKPISEHNALEMPNKKAFFECIQAYEKQVLAYLIDTECLSQKAGFEITHALYQQYGREVARPALKIDEYFKQNDKAYSARALRQAQMQWILQNGGNQNATIPQNEIYRLLVKKLHTQAKQIVSDAIALNK